MGRTTEHRISLLRNLATSLINADKEYIVTTVQKAKELRPFVEKVITLARRAERVARGSTRRREGDMITANLQEAIHQLMRVSSASE